MEGTGKPVLQKPPGYRDPAVPAARAKPPPRKSQLPPTLRHPGKPSRRHKTGRSCCCRFCCCLFVLIVAILVLLAAAGGFSYLWFRPHFPSFHVENVTISVFNITSRSDGTFLDAGGTIKIQAMNPNTKLGLSYRAAEGKFAVADKDGEVDLGTGSAAGFTLGRKNSTTLIFRVAAKGVVVDDSVGARLWAQYKSKEIKFMAEMRTKLGFVVNGKSTPKFSIRVTCPAVSLKQVNGRRPLTKCELDFFNGEFDTVLSFISLLSHHQKQCPCS
ncbi:hypothetical protein KSP40_PGU017368 [Platanthera guangdongensis]|uniref:Late embryogenesis abundant protein LEA-2 subgroup domain-containing protein n=1 Tax=Platanthera guangdongensis TaxID=2320717 RepID=A0ABR2N315_9ASPA